MTDPADATLPTGPREVFDRFQRGVVGNAGSLREEWCAPDAVIELPFAAPGRPRRFQSRQAFFAFAAPQRAALPVRFDEVRNVVVHETTDPEVIVAEYELVGTVTTTGRSAAASFVVVLRVHDGQIVLWREYQNVLAIAAALDQLPTLLAGTAGQPESAGAGSGANT